MAAGREAPSEGARERSQVPIRPLAWAARALGTVGVLLVFAAGIQLFVLAGHTDRAFARRIQPPLTAAVLGAFYWAALAHLLFGAARPT
jgi:hypothetical protein